ncbi:MAG: ABC transporter permease [Clostridiales bacterium]|nr:ABC transporter permease [Clostridiales bacterium]
MQTLKMALKSIGSNKLRAFLTMLGIIIGVMALVILVSLVNGATGSVNDTISGLGNNMISVSISDNKGAPVQITDLSAWMQEPSLGSISAYAKESFTGKKDGNAATVEVYGVTACYDRIQGMTMLLGRFLKSTDVDNHSYVCVINEALATELAGYTDCLGREITLGGIRYTVVGVIKDDETSLTKTYTNDSPAAYIPYTSLVRMSNTATLEITSFYVGVPENGSVKDVEERITQILLDRFEEDEDAFKVKSQDTLEDTMNDVNSALTILLGGIAAISLIVGGIGIMNIMLVTVTERTREIGIRKAIGANRRVILQQFLLEAVALCMMGCAIGIGLSWAALQVISIVVSSLSISFRLNGTIVLVAVGFCFLIGIVFGLYPANKAAKMKPIDALHYGG